VKQDGRWVPVSATLHRVDDGYAPAATPSGLVLSGGGRGPLAVMTTSGGRRLTLSVPFALPAPAVSGATATYRNVLPGVDLQVAATSQGGLTDSLVIKNADAAKNPAVRGFRVSPSASGLTLHTSAAGEVAAAVPGGSTFVMPAPRVKLATLLSAPKLAFPVKFAAVVNPASSGTEGYAEAKQDCSSDPTYNVPQTNGEGIGYQNSPGTTCEGLYRSYWQINTTNLNSSMDISSATLLIAETYGSDLDCSDTWPATLKWTGGIGSGTEWNSQPGVIETLSTAYPKSANCGTQDVDFDVTGPMQTTAENNDTQWTFGLFGDESLLGQSSCSPSSEYNCGFMRFNNNPSITTVFDIAPNTPTNTNTTPQSHNDGTVTGPGCGSNAIGWIGKTDLGSGNGSSVTLNATVVSNIVGEHVRAQYTVWDNSAPNNPVGANVVASPDSAYVASGTTVDTPVGIALKDGHAYGWRARADDGTLQSGFAPDCHFNVDHLPAVRQSWRVAPVDRHHRHVQLL
jgi:hypothetical protein